ncbi:bpX6 domain-containing protein [Polyangium aurulentum]|uniref:bpX6 domain-containing protein n=1 Tax=Polyangium aurulentum TaxID=2567896 RepID=UPI0010AEB1B8|nr:bpX6 domain-containing protein [Polyangium aurulentum]UQA57500.1 protein phosphatase 2C domain-containing protein [Polyangium aurulentum]
MTPRRLVHRGTVLAAGFFVDTALVGEGEARRRILALDGVEAVRRGAAGLFVRLRAPAWVDAARAPGTPLVASGGVLCAAPLDGDEIEALAPPSGAALLVRAGEVVVVDPEAGKPEDLVGWIDVGAWSAVEVTPLGQPLAAPAPAPVPVPIDARRALGLGPLAREGQSIARALARGANEGAEHPRLRERALVPVLSLLTALAARLFVPRGGKASTGRALTAVPQSPAARDTWLERTRVVLQNALARLLVKARLAQLVGRRQAEYLARTLDMFDAGDLERALRHAIPLGKGIGAPKPPSLSVPSPRDALDIHPERAEARSALGLGPDLFGALRVRYRRAFERLEAEGRIQEAAFVLAELLDASEEAVSFLERHGELKLAAELAEGRQLAPGLVIRQWILAGDRARAVRIARRTGAFADAVARLEPSHREHAATLRLLWADKLAEAGAYAAAVDAVWPVEPARHFARAWINRGIEVGGATGAKLLARKARVAPEEMASVVALSRALLRESGVEAQRAQLAFTHALLDGPPTPETRVLARASVRALLPRVDEPKSRSLLERLIDAAGDAALRADTRGMGGVEAPPTQNIRIRAVARTDIGDKRTVNEDGYLIAMLGAASATELSGPIDERALPPRGAVFAVIDGLGGSRSGEGAVELARSEMVADLAKVPPGPGVLGQYLPAAVQAANRAIYRKGREDRTWAGTGGTCTAAALAGDVLWLAQVGDTRCYVLREGRLVQVTRDHSLLEDLLASGQLTPEQAEAFEPRNVITRALGMQDTVVVDLWKLPLCRGDRILLSTDGIHGVVGDDALREALARSEPQAACDALVEEAYRAGAPDNLTAILLDVWGEDLPAPTGDVTPEFVPTPAGGGPIDPIVRRAADAGAHAVLDAALLPGGRVLVALGEAGVRLLSPEGKTLVHFAQPAHRLVLSDHGDRALALAPRGGAWRIARIDIAGRRARPWCDARLDHFASSFDGATWFIAAGDAVHAIDVLDEGWQSLWDVAEPGQKPGRFARAERVCSFLMGDEIWTVEQASFKLQARQPVGDEEAFAGLSLSPWGSTAWAWIEREAKLRPAMRARGASAWSELLPEKEALAAGEIVASEALAALVLAVEAGREVVVLDGHDGIETLRITLEGATAVRVRIQEMDRVVVADDRGRVLAIAGKSGEILGEWRVS